MGSISSRPAYYEPYQPDLQAEAVLESRGLSEAQIADWFAAAKLEHQCAADDLDLIDRMTAYLGPPYCVSVTKARGFVVRRPQMATFQLSGGYYMFIWPRCHDYDHVSFNRGATTDHPQYPISGTLVRRASFFTEEELKDAQPMPCACTHHRPVTTQTDQ